MFTAPTTTKAFAGFRGGARPNAAAVHAAPAYANAMAGASWQIGCIPSTDVVTTDHKLRSRRPEEVASQH